MSNKTITILESQFDSMNVFTDYEIKWKIFENYANIQLDRMSINDIDNITDEKIKSNLIQFKFYLDKREQNKKNGSKGGTKTQSKYKDNAQAMLKQCSSNAQENFKQYKYKNKYKDKSKEINIYMPTKDEVLSYAKSIGCNEQIAIDFFKHYSSNNWKDNKGNNISNWKNTLQWWKNSNSKNSNNDILPTYDTSKNKDYSKEETDELLGLMGRNKISDNRLKELAKENGIQANTLIDFYREHPSLSEKQLIEEIQKQKENQYDN